MNKEVKSLYRIYRPQKFSDVISQEHVTKTLENQIKSGKTSHAYLFCGTRGTGKTSVAKIFAREVNNNKISDMDVLEIDAASNNSVQDVRDLIEKVKYPPVTAKYKVYIVDEVHMFSSAAFNAFLKTLEEPPSHVIFILCTTEPQKLPPTIQSRCLRFDFRSASQESLEKHLAKILKQEQIEATNEAIKLLAEAGSGSFRDTLSFAETVIAYSGQQKITEKQVCEVLGTCDSAILQKLLDNILKSDSENINKNLQEIFKSGINTSEVTRRFLEIIKTNFYKTKEKVLLEYYKIFAELELNIKNALNPRALFEGAILICLTHQKSGHAC